MAELKALTVWAGARAAEVLEQRGWDPDVFSTMIGASGGPKWLVLSQLDRVIHETLLAPRTRPIDLVGSSIGTWRHACLSLPDPGLALARFETAYIAQTYSRRPSPSEVSEVATEILLEALGPNGPAELLGQSMLRNHIVTARGRGVSGGVSVPGIVFGMGAAALANAVHRPLLGSSFQRVVFSQSDSGLPHWLAGFGTRQAELSQANLVRALKASGAIPMVLEPERDIPGTAPGTYWDGGIIDYHFEPPRQWEDGLILYPHFTDTLTPGWFDKFLPWRRRRTPVSDSLVLISPSREFVASLPHGKIPDRGDFARFDDAERQRYWRTTLAACEALANEFRILLASDDPLSGVRRL